MVKTLVQISVADYKQWRAAYESVDSLRKSFGCTGAQVFTNDDNSKEVFVLLSWKDGDQARAYLQSPELREAMQKGGVQGMPVSHYLSEV